MILISISSVNLLFYPSAGTASWETLLRAERHCGLLLRLRRAARLWFLQNRYDVIFGTSSKAALGLAIGDPLALGAPQEGIKGETKITEEIKIREKSEANKALVSWAAVDRGGDETGNHSRGVHPLPQLLLGNQILALVQCHSQGIQPGPLATFPKWKDLDGVS